MNGTTENLTEHQIAEALRRQTLLERFAAMEGKTLNEAARELEVSPATLCRWAKAYELGGFRALVPRVSTGRPSEREKLKAAVGPEAFDKTVETVKGHNLDSGSNEESWRWNTRPEAPAPDLIKAAIHDPAKRSKHNIARSLTNLTKLTRAQRLAFRGRRALALHGSSVPRRMDVLPGDVFVPDDTTPIWAWWVPWPKCKQYPFGKKVLQGQLILMVDYASLCRIGYALIAREHASYRACDIWSFYGDVFDGIGLPRLGTQHEGGTFQAKQLVGETIQYHYSDGEASEDRRIGALSLLPSQVLPFHRQTATIELHETLQVYRSFFPKTKPVEMAFNLSQKLEGTLWGCLGRDQRRAPFEKAQKIFEACKRGAADPGLHFLSMTEIEKRLTPLMEYQNEDRMEGAIYHGKPVDAWGESLTKHPLRILPEDLRWLYRRDWKMETIKGAFVDVSYKDDWGKTVNLHYHNADLFARIDGQRALVYFDKENPERAAEIVSLNGERLGGADYWTGTGGIIDRNPEGYEIQKQYRQTVMSLTRVIAKSAPSRQLPVEIAARREQARAEAETQNATPLAGSGRRNEPSKALTREELLHYGQSPEERKQSERELTEGPKL